MTGSDQNNSGASDNSGASFPWEFRSDTPVFKASLRPNRSLPPKGLAWLLLITWGFLLVPLVPLLGTTALWAMLPFLLAPLGALWYFVKRNNYDGTLHEELWLWSDMIAVSRRNPRAKKQCWCCNPFWVTLKIREKGGPVENYITLNGDGRTIELGAFLSPEQRAELHVDLQRALKCLGGPANG